MNEEHEHEHQDEEFLGGIFAEAGDTIENMRANAAALGINPDLVATEEEQLRYVARSNCKSCFGRGTLTICLSPSKPKIFHVNKSEVCERRHGGASKKRTKAILGLSPGNDLHEEWDLGRERDEEKRKSREGALKKLLGKVPHLAGSATGRPEPQGYKARNTSQAFCRCVRAISA